jgi:Ger(x)C family germination protein
MKKIIIILLCFLLTGCYNYNEIDDLAIISCLGIDYANGKYQIIIEEEKNDKDNKKSTLLYYSEDISLDKAIQKAAYKIDKTLYFIDLDVLLLSTNVANNHLNSVMDYITRENNFAFNFNMVLAENPRQIIETLDNKKNTISGKYIKNIFNAEFNSIINIKYSEFMETYLNGSKNVILPFASINDKGVTLDKAYLFNNSKLTYLLKSQNMQIYNLLNSYNKIYLFKIYY